MSPLTKVFVVVHVILSILLTAALVVFVNRVEDIKSKTDMLNSQLSAERHKSEGLASALALAKDASTSNFQALQQQLATEKSRTLALQNQIGDRDTNLAALQASNAQLTASLSSATEANKASEANKAKLNDMVVENRKQIDDLTKKISEANTQISTLTNNYEVAARELKYSQEQLVESKGQVQHLQGVVAKFDPNLLKSGNAPVAPPSINAVIRNVKVIEGKKWATISVGALNDVKKGMEFKLIDVAKGEFLGVLTVDSVEDNESTGYIDGPHVDQVTKDIQARTQL